MKTKKCATDKKFAIDERYNHISPHWDYINEMSEWCSNKDNGNFDIYVTGFVYKTERDLTAFVLRWA